MSHVFDTERLAQDNIYIRLMTLPCTVSAFTLYDKAEGIYNIYLNERLAGCEQQQAVEHELEHIRRKDFISTSDVDMLELRLGL